MASFPGGEHRRQPGSLDAHGAVVAVLAAASVVPGAGPFPEKHRRPEPAAGGTRMNAEARDTHLNPMHPPTTPATCARMAVLLPALVVLLLGLESCTFGTVATIKGDSLDATRGQPSGVTVTGTRTCTALSLDWGDGFVDTENNVDFAANPSGVHFLHTYTGWGGNRAVTVTGVTNCTGTARVAIRVVPPFSVALRQPAASACNMVLGPTALRVGQSVHITTNPNPADVIDFGCAFGGCTHDADGEANSSAGSGFPFPGLRKYSLILRIGTQVEQGGTNVTFQVHQAGPLELCVNDDSISDNSGGWGVFIDVNG
jgi:hypothetical protein